MPIFEGVPKPPQIIRTFQKQPRDAFRNRRDAHKVSNPYGIFVSLPFGFGLKTRGYARWAARKLIGKVLDNEHCLLDAI